MFYALVNDRGQSTTTKYVRGLMRENIYRKGLLKYLLTFAKADSARARSYGDKLKDFERVLTDCERAEQELVEEEAAKARRQAVTLERMPRIKAYLEAEGVPEAADALPDLKAAHRILGTMGRYDLIKGIKAIIDAASSAKKEGRSASNCLKFLLIPILQ